MKGKIVLIHFPFTDLTSSKLRPALVLMEAEKDCVVAFISSKIPAEPSPTEILISEDYEEFAGTGLKRTSVIRGGEIENSIILNSTTIECGKRIVDSLIGKGSMTVSNERNLPKGYKLIIGENAFLSI